VGSDRAEWPELTAAFADSPPSSAPGYKDLGSSERCDPGRAESVPARIQRDVAFEQSCREAAWSIAG
jgi:hypothetical protein